MIGSVQQAAKLNQRARSGRSAPASIRATRELPTPPDLAAALEKNKPAARSFASFTPSQRKDYIAWITDAKRQETREKRLATTIA